MTFDCFPEYKRILRRIFCWKSINLSYMSCCMGWNAEGPSVTFIIPVEPPPLGYLSSSVSGFYFLFQPAHGCHLKPTACFLFNFILCILFTCFMIHVSHLPSFLKQVKYVGLNLLSISHQCFNPTDRLSYT